MNRPAHEVARVLHKPGFAPRRAFGLAVALSVTLLLFWAIASGLAVEIVKQIPHVLQVSVVQTPQKPQPVIPPPQLKEVQPAEPTVPVPQIVIQQPQPAAITVKPAPPQPITPPAPVQAVPNTPPQGIASTHTIPPYPPLARRLGEQGKVLLHLVITPQGTVSAAQIVKSSGSTVLDQAAAAWVQAHWRYKPAVVNGKSAAGAENVAIVFDLKQAQY